VKQRCRTPFPDFGMGKYRGGPKPWEKNDPKGRRLDPGQYPELNAVFYTADPAEFIKMPIEEAFRMSGKQIKLFLIDGTPSGLTTAESTNWTGHIPTHRLGSRR